MRVSLSISGALASILTMAGLSIAQENVLTTEEAGSGYIQLFNGTNLTNWKTYNSTTPPPSWVVQTDGDAKAIVVVAGGVGHLVSKQNDFQNFDLKIEWKVPISGNSGIFIRYLEIDAWAGASGPEAQVVDINNSDGTQSLHRAGTCYDMIPLMAGRDNWWKPTGEWNQFRIIAYNSKIAHYGNGKKLLEYDMTSQSFLDRYTVSKYKDKPQYKTVHPGSIYLQHHGETGIKYRNIRIKKLTQDPWAAGSPYLKTGGGLVDDMTFAINIFPTPTGIPHWLPENGDAVRIQRGADGVTLLFPSFGEYMVRFSDLQGRTNSSQIVRGGSWSVPSGLAANSRVLSVTRGSNTIHKSLLPAF